MGGGSRVIKRLSTGCRERDSGRRQTAGEHRSPSKASGLQAMFEAEPSEETIAQTSLWVSQLAEVSQVVAHLVDDFHLLIPELVLQEVTEMRANASRTQACR